MFPIQVGSNQVWLQTHSSYVCFFDVCFFVFCPSFQPCQPQPNLPNSVSIKWPVGSPLTSMSIWISHEMKPSCKINYSYMERINRITLWPDPGEISNRLCSGLPSSFIQPVGPTPLHQIGYSGLASVLFRAWAGQPQPNLPISVRVEWPGRKPTDCNVDPDLPRDLPLMVRVGHRRPRLDGRVAFRGVRYFLRGLHTHARIVYSQERVPQTRIRVHVWQFLRWV